MNNVLYRRRIWDVISFCFVLTWIYPCVINAKTIEIPELSIMNVPLPNISRPKYQTNIKELSETLESSIFRATAYRSYRKKLPRLEGRKKSEILSRHNMGDFTESFMDRYFEGSGKWHKQKDVQVGRSGFDGLFTRRKGNGRLDVLIVEAKYGDSELGMTKTKGPQMSAKWDKKTIDEKINSLEKRKGGAISELEKQKIEKQIKEWKEYKLYIEKGVYRKRLFHLDIVDGEVQITLYGVEETTDKTGKTTVDRTGVGNDNIPMRPGTEKGTRSRKKGADVSDVEMDDFKLVESKSDPDRIKNLRKVFYDDLEKKLSSELHPDDAKQIIDRMKNGEIKSREELYKEIAQQRYRGKSFAKTMKDAHFTPKQIERYERMARKRVLGNRYILEKVVQYQYSVNYVRDTVCKVYEYAKTPDKIKRTFDELRKIDMQKIKDSLRQKETWVKLGKGTVKVVAVIFVVYELGETYIFWSDYAKGYRTDREMYGRVGETAGSLTIGLKLGKKFAAVGLKRATITCPKFRDKWAVGICMVVIPTGSFIVGMVTGTVLGEYTGDVTYTFLHNESDDIYQRKYFRDIESWLSQGSL